MCVNFSYLIVTKFFFSVKPVAYNKLEMWKFGAKYIWGLSSKALSFHMKSHEAVDMEPFFTERAVNSILKEYTYCRDSLSQLKLFLRSFPNSQETRSPKELKNISGFK